MKIYCLIAVVVSLFDSANAADFATKKGGHKATFRVMAGARSDYGLIGAEAGWQAAPHWEIHGGAGLGPQVRVGGGARVTTQEYECFLFKFCTNQYNFGVTATHGRKARGEGEDEFGNKVALNFPETTFVNANIGLVTYFFTHLNFGVNMGYQHALGVRDSFQFTDSQTNQSEFEIDRNKKLNNGLNQLMRGFQFSSSIGISI